MTSVCELLIWNHPFHLRLRSHCRRSRWYSVLPSPASPDTGSCPSPLERCQNWWGRLREDGWKSPSLLSVDSPAHSTQHVLFYNKVCFNQSSQYVFSSITCFWPAEQTFPLWAEGVTGGAVWCSVTCLIQGMWDCGYGSENACSSCDLWTRAQSTAGVFWRCLQPFPRPAEMKMPQPSRALTNQDAASLTHPRHASSPNKHHCSIIIEIYMTRPAPPPL